ncbi:MAG TPA: hypothetical protein VJY35_08870 [Candidatus Eisenbacteria bacterium]|nr:hypothetical protein [Candidatus Eisenbacteria bacterium]
MSPAQYAQHRGVSKVAVQKAIATGRIPATRKGRRILIDPELADRAWAQNTDTSKPRNSVTGRPKVVANGHAAPPPAGTQAAENLKLTGIKAQMAALELDRRSGRLVDAEAADARFFELCRGFRDKLFALADRLGPEMAPITNARACTLRLREEFKKLAQELAGIESEDQGARTGS